MVAKGLTYRRSSIQWIASAGVLGLAAIAMGVSATDGSKAEEISITKQLAAEHRPAELVLKLRGARGAPFARSAIGESKIESMHSFVTDPALQLVRLKRDADL